MRSRTLLVMVLVGLTTLGPSPASANGGPSDFVRVTKVLVNRLGGVSVIGEMSCAGTAQAVREGKIEGLTWVAGDGIVIITNPDEYTVSQPVGRRSMLQVSHVSSRAHPCYTDMATFPDGTPITCPVDASSCAWATDRFGYDAATFGPLFDYAPNGKFKTGSLDVSGNSSGLYITLCHPASATDCVSYDDGEGFFIPYSQVLKAVSYR